MRSLRGMRVIWLLLPALLLALAGAACDGDEVAPAPEASATVAAVPATAPAEAGRRIVYVHQTGEVATAERLWKTVEIVTYDLDEGRVVSSFEVGGVGEYPGEVRLAGETLIVGLEKRVAAFALDGSGERTLIKAPAGQFGSVGSALPSPDGKLVALYADREATGADGALRLVSSVVVLEMATGATVATFENQTLTAPVTWLGDGSGFVLFPGHGSDRFAVQSLDGDARTYETGGSTRVAPGGRYASTLTGVGPEADLVCFSAKPELAVRDVAADRVVSTVRPENASMEMMEWSPDGEELAYSLLPHTGAPAEPGCVSVDTDQRSWYRLRPGGAPEAAPDLFTLRREWEGDRYVEYRCGGERRTDAYCERGENEIYVGGRLIAAGTDARVAGFVE